MARHFKNWLKAYLEYTQSSESPTLYHFWCGVSTIASALRRQVWVDELIFQYVPNFYIILVGPAGVAKKSTTINLGMALLEEIKDIYFGPNSGSWQGLADRLRDSTIWFKLNPEDENEKPRAMSAITVAASELGTFFHPDDTQAMAFLTDVWDGKQFTYRHSTRHSGSPEIVNPLLNIIGATTPAWLRNNVPESIIGEGFTSRVVFVYAERPRQIVARPSKISRGSHFHDLRAMLIEDLIQIANLRGPYEYAPDADAWMEKWYTGFMNGGRSVHLASDRFAGYISRKQAHLVKTAMVLAAAKRNELVLHVEDFTEAEVLLEETEHSMIKVFESIGLVDEAKHVAEIVSFVRAHKWITSQELYRLCYNIMRETDFRQALRIAVEGGMLEKEQREGKWGVKPAPRVLN